jgi:hypothetical protein
MSSRHASAAVVTLCILLAVVGAAVGQPADSAGPAEPDLVAATPPRLSFVDGQVSFWRPGADEWVAAAVNTALAAGDELYTGSPGNLEIQFGERAYARAWASTQLGVASLEPDFVQFKVTTGYLALDVRRLESGQTIEVDTPNAAFTIERTGYYRVEVTPDRTSFLTRRGGRATVTPASGAAAAIAASEEVVVQGADGATVATYVAPELDVWDRWNYARTDALIDAVSARYVPAGVYGIDDLDQYGSWRVVDTYGSVWVPAGVPAGWAPYTSGSWMWDPYYGWTWVDTSPWGWAPYHHGRWVFVGGVWGWAPGPLVVRPVYAPALVAFLGPRVGVTIGPSVGWVALGWGEPLIPWWGRPGFVGAPWWAGWGGPRIVNNVVITHTTVVHVHDIHVYRNAGVRNAVVVVPRDRFGRGPVPPARARVDPDRLEPFRGKLDVPPARASLTPDRVRGARPPEKTLERRVVATRAPADPSRWLKAEGLPEPSRPAAPPRVVPAPARREGTEPAPRPPFGASKIERPRPAQPPRAVPPATGPSTPRASRPTPSVPQPPAPTRPTPPATREPSGAPAPSARRPAAPAPRPETRALPGESANRVFPGRVPQASRGATTGRAPSGEPRRPAAPGPSHEGGERRAR